MKNNWKRNILPYKEISPVGGQFFFGYYDLKAMNKKIHLTHKASFIDRLQLVNDEVEVGYIPIETGEFIYLDKTNAWNPQQGTMFYWNPNAPETQFFFNDRDIKTGEVYTVLYDIKKKNWKYTPSLIYSMGHHCDFIVIIVIWRFDR